MADKFFKIAAILTAVDQMSSVFASASQKSIGEMNKMQKQMEVMRNASLMIGVGKQGLGFVKQFVDSSADMEEAGNKLKAVLTDKTGIYNVNTYNQIENLSQKLSNVYAQSAMDYVDAARIFKQNRIEPNDILGGVLESTARLSDYFDRMNPGQIALFASRMKNDFGIAAKDMVSMMDLLARLKDSGVGGSNGPMAVEQMTQFFGKASLGMANMRNIGLKSAMELGTVGGYFISRGLSAETVGTNVRRIYDTLRNPERLGQISQAADNLAGVHFRFYDQDKKFLGMANFIQELGKLKGLDVQTIDSILSKPFGGKMGLSSEMVAFLAQNGTDKYKEFGDSLENQATLSQKLGIIMDGLNYKQSVMKSTSETLKQILGRGLLDVLKKYSDYINKVIVKFEELSQEHPRISKFIMLFTSISSAAVVLVGTIRALSFGISLLGISASGAATAFLSFGLPIAALAAILSNLDIEIYSVNGHMVTLGEIVWNIIRPIEQLLGLLGQIGKAFAVWRPGFAQGDYFDRKNNFWLNGIDEMDEKFKKYGSVLTPNAIRGTGQFIFNNHITVNGTGPAIAEQVAAHTQDAVRQFERLMKEYDASRERKRF